MHPIDIKPASFTPFNIFGALSVMTIKGLNFSRENSSITLLIKQVMFSDVWEGDSLLNLRILVFISLS